MSAAGRQCEFEVSATWTFVEARRFATATYDWRVDVGKPSMRPIPSLLRRVFAWNHRMVI